MRCIKYAVARFAATFNWLSKNHAAVSEWSSIPECRVLCATQGSWKGGGYKQVSLMLPSVTLLISGEAPTDVSMGLFNSSGRVIAHLQYSTSKQFVGHNNFFGTLWGCSRTSWWPPSPKTPLHPPHLWMYYAMLGRAKCTDVRLGLTRVGCIITYNLAPPSKMHPNVSTVDEVVQKHVEKRTIFL